LARFWELILLLATSALLLGIPAARRPMRPRLPRVRAGSGWPTRSRACPLSSSAAIGKWRVLAVAANRMPTAAGYLRRPGDTKFRAAKLDVMRMQASLIAKVTVFNAELFPALGPRSAL
jgi:hypothetical protein